MPVSRQLVAFELGKGARIAASKQESLPSGWAAAARGDDTTLPGPRIAPDALAAADPPLSFAGPSSDSSTMKGRGKASQSDRIRVAERDPARKLPRKASKSGYGVHIGSFRSEKRAERGWTLFENRYKRALRDQPHIVVSIDLGEPKGVMYRVLAGPFETAAKGSALCKRVRQQGGYCRVLPIPRG